MDPLTLMTVHAHPDDESSKGAATVARYHHEGVRTILVCCTGGEEGDILNKAMDRPGVKERMAEIRAGELADAAAIIGYDEVVSLGYRDSGMPESPANADPASFAQAPLDEAVGRLVAAIRAHRPQVVVTYPRDQAGYPHPDHLRVNEISELAFDAAADPAAHPEAGPAWQPSKLVSTSWSARQMLATHQAYVDRGLESPFDEERRARFDRAVAAEAESTAPPAVVDVEGFTHVRREALLAHRTQVDPESPWWFGLPPEVQDGLYPFDEYRVLRNLTGAPDDAPDLFAGLREAARTS